MLLLILLLLILLLVGGVSFPSVRGPSGLVGVVLVVVLVWLLLDGRA